MHPLMKPSVALWAFLLVVSPSSAATLLKPNTVAVGSTGILCYQPPCPWRGIAAPDDVRPLWSGEILPVIEGTAENKEQIARAWREFDCLVVEGEFDGSTLTVRHVLGSCP